MLCRRSNNLDTAGCPGCLPKIEYSRLQKLIVQAEQLKLDVRGKVSGRKNVN